MADAPTFLGTGWTFPPAFTSRGADVETVSGAEDIRQSLEILFGTAPGERVLQEDFGSDLSRYLFEEIDRDLIQNLTSLISDAILYHEPRIHLNDLEISEAEAEAGLLLIQLDFTVRSTNSRFNMVYPFYLSEAVAPGG
jgi:phage baseplate assembly protein W